MFALVEDQRDADRDERARTSAAFYNAHFQRADGRKWTPQDFGAIPDIDRPENAHLKPYLEKINAQFDAAARAGKQASEARKLGLPIDESVIPVWAQAGNAKRKGKKR
jgi:hypothetical protein